MPDAGVTLSLVREGQILKLRARNIHAEVTAGPALGLTRVFAISAELGSGVGCDSVLADPAVSRNHASLRVDSTGLRVIDNSSRNGTSIDGVRVRDGYAGTDSYLTLGNSTLRVRLRDDTTEVALSSRERFGGLHGASVPMRQLYTLLERVAPLDVTVLVEGETGTGKELVAEALHDEGSRSAAPFVVFDCSAVSANLIESELFGHVRGAFTGAHADRMGVFEAADGGTLFLDEIGELPLDLQPKLLRLLESREVRRVGSTQVRKVDVRVVAATNRPLAAEVDAGRFREDSYYRLAVVHVKMPPLRERIDDIPVLANRFATELGHPLPPRTLQAFQAQPWPGNVRELRNAVERTISLGEEPDAPAVAPQAPARAAVVDLSIPLKAARERIADDFERAYILRALEQSGGNVTRAAELAGVNRKFIQRALKRYGLRDSD